MLKEHLLYHNVKNIMFAWRRDKTMKIKMRFLEILLLLLLFLCDLKYLRVYYN